MILYHGSNLEIHEIDLEKCKPYKDFGRGFYLTTIRGQANEMAIRIANIYGGTPVVNAYDYDETSIKELSTLKFEKPSEGWARFVINNRNRNYLNISDPDNNHDSKYDIVTGPVANDKLVFLFKQFEDDLLDIEVLVKRMEYRELTNQYSFHTTKAISSLSFFGVENE